MRKIVSIILVVTLLISVTNAQAGIWDDAKKLVGGAVEGVTEAVESIGEAAKDAYDSISKQTEIIWNDLSVVLTDAWDWTTDIAVQAGDSISAGTSKAMDTLKNYVSDGAEMTEETIKNAFEQAAVGIGITSENVERIWNSIVKYADEHNINLLSVVKLTLAIIIRIFARGRIGDMAGNYITDMIVEWFDGLEVSDFKKAEDELLRLEESLFTDEQLVSESN